MVAERVAVVTGATRGIGFETVRRLCKEFKGKVVLTGRSEYRAHKAVERLGMQGCFPVYYQLDVTDHASRQRFAAYVNKTYGGLDALVNNAGVMFGEESRTPFRFQVRDTVTTNFYGTLFLCQLLFPLLRPHARVVNLSSACGFLSDIPSEALRRRFGKEGLRQNELLALIDELKASVASRMHRVRGWGDNAYCVSQVALTAFTRLQQREFHKRPADDLVVNCYNPGDVATRMTAYTGALSPSTASKNVVRLATLPPNVTSPVGQYVWHDLRVVDWKGEKPDY